MWHSLFTSQCESGAISICRGMPSKVDSPESTTYSVTAPTFTAAAPGREPSASNTALCNPRPPHCQSSCTGLSGFIAQPLARACQGSLLMEKLPTWGVGMSSTDPATSKLTQYRRLLTHCPPKPSLPPWKLLSIWMQATSTSLYSCMPQQESRC